MHLTLLRRIAEALGVAVYCALHLTAIPLVVVLGASLPPIDRMPGVYYAVLGLGYVLTWLVLIRAVRRGGLPGRRVTRSLLVEVWLMAFLSALVITSILVVVRLPLRLQGWDGHGFGATGGEANVVFLPWLQMGLWLQFHARTRLRGVHSG